MKIINILFVLLLFLPFSSAMSWEEGKGIIQETTMRDGYGKNLIRYAYYEHKSSKNNVVLAEFTYWNNGRYLITFYNESFNYNKQELKCITLHELGHYKDYKKGNTILKESIANNYMQKNKECITRWSE